jgi:hypothetical protein
MTKAAERVAKDVITFDEELMVVNFDFDIVLYNSQDFTKTADGVQFFYDRALALCPRGALRWHATENMSSHRAVTPKVLQMLPNWLRPGAPARPVVHIHLKDGATYADAAGYSIWLWGDEPTNVGRYGRHSNVLRCTLPAADAAERLDELRELAIELCRRVPFDSGHAGYVLETTPYRQESSERAAFRGSMRYPGLDISNPLTDSVALRREAIKGVNWLTMVSTDMLDRIGGLRAVAAKLPADVIVHQVPAGAIFQADVAPRFGEEAGDDLSAYRAVYGALADLQRPLLDRYGAFDLPGGTHREKTRAWLQRLSNE